MGTDGDRLDRQGRGHHRRPLDHDRDGAQGAGAGGGANGADRDDRFGLLARKAARWTVDHLEALRQADPDVPGALNDRQADNWRGLLAIADLCGSEWPTRARAAALALSATDEDGETIGVQALADLKVIFAGHGDPEQLFSATLVTELTAMEGRPWPEMGKSRKPLTTNGLARLLKPFGITPAGTIRIKDTTGKGYLREQFEKAWNRYLPKEGASEPSQRHSQGNPPHSEDSQPSHGDSGVTDENRPKATDSAACDGVMFSEPLPGREVPCDHCGEPVEPGEPGTTATISGEHLHNGCVDAWLRRDLRRAHHTQPEAVAACAYCRDVIHPGDGVDVDGQRIHQRCTQVTPTGHDASRGYGP